MSGWVVGVVWVCRWRTLLTFQVNTHINAHIPGKTINVSNFFPVLEIRLHTNANFFWILPFILLYSLHKTVNICIKLKTILNSLICPCAAEFTLKRKIERNVFALNPTVHFQLFYRSKVNFECFTLFQVLP